MNNEIDDAYAKALGALNTLHRAAERREVAEGEILRLRAQNDAIVAALRARDYKGVDLAADVVALILYCDGLSAQLADKDRAKGLDCREPAPDIVRAFKGINGEWRTHKGGAAAVGSRVAWADGYAAEADESWDFQYVPINLPDDEARRKWAETAPCWDLPRTERVTVEGVGLVEKK